MKDIIERLIKGEFVIVFDHEERENEADLILPSQFSTPEKVSFVLNNARGMFCVAIDKEIQKRLNLYVPYNIEDSCTFTATVDHVSTTTGISASDRSITSKELANPQSKPSDFKIPGHVSPVVAKEGGVFTRRGHTESAIELCNLADLHKSAIMVEILDEFGNSHNKEYVFNLSRKYGIKTVTIDQIVKYLLLSRRNIALESEANLPTAYGYFKIFAFKNIYTQKEHAVLVNKSFDKNKTVNLRIHSSCKTGDVFHSKRCDCQSQLNFYLDFMGKNENCMLIYLDQEGRGIGFSNKIKAYKLQEQGFDTYEANNILGFDDDLRDYYDALQILDYFGVNKVKIATSNPEKVEALKEGGIEIVDFIKMPIFINEYNKRYLYSKIIKKNHNIYLKGEDVIENL